MPLDNSRSWVSGLALALACALLAPLGCAGQQEQETTPPPAEPPPPPPPQDYYGRLQAALTADGLSLDELRCNVDVTWAEELRADAEAFYRDMEATLGPLMRPRVRESDREMAQEQGTDLTMNWFIRVLILHGDFNNLGAVVLPSVTWTDESGASHPLVVFHSATTPRTESPGSCFRSLLDHGRVRHVLNLYDGRVPLRDRIDAEARVAEEAGASYVDASQVDLGYRGWRELAANAEASEEERAEAAATIARLIREQILRPGGEPPRGNVYFHCAGGMHRSPLISGILRRCVAQEPAEQVREAMELHSAYESAEAPGGWEEPIYDFVQAFDCSLLTEQPATEASEAGEGSPEGAEPELDADEE